MSENLPKYGDVLVEEGKATLEFHVFLEDIAGNDGGAVEVQDEGTVATVALNTLNFVGSGVVAAETTPGVIDVTVAGAGTTAWGDITGTLANQTDLQSAIDAKAAASHVHSTNNITSGVFIDARIQESNVTQHQAALSIGLSQLASGGATTGDTIVYDSVAGEWVTNLTQLIRDVKEVADDIYIGEALANTATSAAGWRLYKVSSVSDDPSKRYADGDTNFDNVMDDYLTKSYS